MTKFQPGDRVKIVSLTDVDDKSHVLRTNEEAYAFDPSLGGMIGSTATVKELLCDYYDVVIVMDEPDENYPEFNEPPMLERDLVKWCKFKVGDRARVTAPDPDGAEFEGRVGEVVMIQASNEDKPEGPDGPWMVDLKFDDDDYDTYYFDESELEVVK